MKPMQIDKDLFREWILMYIDAMQKMETEVMVYRLVAEALKRYDLQKEIDDLTQKIRERAEIKNKLDEKYGKYRDQVLEYIEKGFQDQDLSRFLQEWKARGPIN